MDKPQRERGNLKRRKTKQVKIFFFFTFLETFLIILRTKNIKRYQIHPFLKKLKTRNRKQKHYQTNTNRREDKEQLKGYYQVKIKNKKKSMDGT